MAWCLVKHRDYFTFLPLRKSIKVVVVVYKNVSKHGLLYAAKNSSECCNNWNGDVIRMDVRNEHENIVYNTDTFQTESIFFLFLLQEGVKKF
jgi:hypothetical protein